MFNVSRLLACAKMLPLSRTVRPYVLHQDAPAVKKLVLENLNRLASPTGESDLKRASDIMENLQREEAHCRVLEVNNQLKGFVCFTRNGSSGEVHYLAVDENHRGAGHGSNLLNKVLEELFQDKSVRTVKLHTTDERLDAFYKRHGFTLLMSANSKAHGHLRAFFRSHPNMSWQERGWYRAKETGRCFLPLFPGFLLALASFHPSQRPH